MTAVSSTPSAHVSGLEGPLAGESMSKADLASNGGSTETIDLTTDMPTDEFFGGAPDAPKTVDRFGVASLLLVVGCSGLAVGQAIDLLGVKAPESGLHIPLVVLTAAFFLAARYCIRERIGGTMHVVAVTELPLILGLFASRPSHVLACAGVGMALAVAFTKQRLRGERLRSLMVSLVECAVVLEVVGRLRPDPLVLRSATWLVVLAVVLSVRFIRLAVLHLVGVVTHEHVSLRHLIATTLVAMAACVCFSSIALIASMVQTQSRLAVLLVVIICALPILAYRAYVVLRERFARLRLLQEYTASLARGAGDLHSTSERAADQARLLLNAQTGEVTLSRGEIAVRTVSGVNERAEAVPAPGDWLWNRITATGRAVLLNPATAGAEVQEYLRFMSSREILAAPLMQGTELLGVLSVRNRPADLNTFSPSDCQLFATMADQTAVAIQAARLRDRVEDEMRAKAQSAFVDPLTGLASRHGLNVAIDELAADRCGALLSLDLNGFKEINSSLGHDLGDDVLVLIAERIRLALPRTATVARLGGDEFAIFVVDVDADAALLLAERVLAILREPTALDAATISLDAALGVAVVPDHGREHAVVMRRADLAMFAAKELGEKSPRIYVEDLEKQSQRRVILLRELRHALATDALTVHYQPKARLVSGEVDGVEALVRWTHPTLGFIPPDEFIGLAEQSGLIEPLTEFVLRTSLADCRRWRDKGLAASVGVNVSVQTLRRPDLLAWLEERLDMAGVAPDGLTLELTEREYVDDDAEIASALEGLNALGVGLSIDDFGAGYSSLGYLRRIIADELKLDRALVKDVATDEDAAAIVTAVVTLADQLGLTTVAEGVEDANTWDKLHELGVAIGQGYLLSRPLPFDAVQAWMWERRLGAA